MDRRAGTVNTDRRVLFSGGQGVATNLLKPLAWTAVIIVLLTLPASRELERNAKPHPSPEL